MYRYDHVDETKLFQCSKTVRYCSRWCGNQSGSTMSLIRKVKKLSEWRKVYAIIGIVSLALVVVIGSVSYGAKLGFQVAGINVQPSELVKIVFVFFVASSFKTVHGI